MHKYFSGDFFRCNLRCRFYFAFVILWNVMLCNQLMLCGLNQYHNILFGFFSKCIYQNKVSVSKITITDQTQWNFFFKYFRNMVICSLQNITTTVMSLGWLVAPCAEKPSKTTTCYYYYNYYSFNFQQVYIALHKLLCVK